MNAPTKYRCMVYRYGYYCNIGRAGLYLLPSWSSVLLEKLTGFQLVKKFPAFYGTRRFITAFTSARQLFLSWASSIHLGRTKVSVRHDWSIKWEICSQWNVQRILMWICRRKTSLWTRHLLEGNITVRWSAERPQNWQ